MRKTFALLAASAALLSLAGCGTLPTERNAPSSYRESLETDVMALVENSAARSGTQVYWINPPRRKKH